MVKNLDALEEWRDMVVVRLADNQQRLALGYNKRVRPRSLYQETSFFERPLGVQKVKVLENWPLIRKDSIE